jgi:hypothetical protein
MKVPVRKVMLVMGTLALGAIWVPVASAACANPLIGARLKPQAWDGRSETAPNLLRTSEDGGGPSMVGLWHVLFIAEGNGPGLPPDGTTVDNGLSEWHSDGTEETLDSRPPATGDVCLGVWAQDGERHYKLNHFGIGFNPSVDPNNPMGYARIQQDIILNPDGKTFTGTFSITQYDASGNVVVQIKGDLLGTRVTLSTTVANLLGS